MRLLIVLWFYSLLALPTFAAPRYAVIVGLNRYEHLPSLRAGVPDSQSLDAHFRQLGYDQVFLLNDQVENSLYTPSINHLLQAMDAIEALALADPPQELVFCFAGHGVQRNGINYLCLADADLESERGLLNVDSQLIPWLRRLQPNLGLVFLDACRQNTVATRGVGWTRGIEGAVEPLNVTDNRPQHAIFYAAQPGGLSYETPDGTHGLFTQTLLEALRQPARNSLGSLRKYLEETLPAKTMDAYGKIQIPSVGGEYSPEALFSSYPGDQGLATFGGHGEVLIQTIPPRAEVFGDGIRLGVAPVLLTGLQARVLRVTAQTSQLFAEDEILVRSTGFKTLQLTLSEKAGRVFLQTDADSPQVSVDQGAFLPAKDHLVAKVPVGQRRLRFLSEQGYSEALVEVVNNETLVLTPQWKPFGSVQLSLPAGSQLLLTSSADGHRRVISGPQSVEYLPPGTYEARNLDTNHLPWHQQIEVLPLQLLSLSPVLVPTEAWLRELKREERAAQWPQEKAWRTGLDTSAGILAAGSVLSAGLAGWFWYRMNDRVSAYRLSGPEGNFGALRTEIRDAMGALQWSASAAAVQAISALLCWGIGPHPGEVAP